MAAEHTPGPWKLIDSTHIGCNSDFKTIASAYDHKVFRMNKEEAKANAKLIAAAPDLLESLKQLVEEITENGVYFIAVGKALESLKKATE